MNGWIGTTHAQDASIGIPGATSFRTFVKDTSVPAPSSIWYFIDEHELSINDGFFLVDPTRARAFPDMPATRHNRGYGISFCDGHTEIYKLLDARTRLPRPSSIDTPANQDYTKLVNVTTVLK
jgi:prepilin-type processing-associated H-X9-DG protein